MLVSDYKNVIPDRVFSVLSSKIDSFLPVQEDAIKQGLFEGNSMIVSSPTASGKTMIAEMGILNAFFSGKKSIYVAPLRALISEKFEDFKKEYPFIKGALSMGDLTEFDTSLEKYDVVFVSTEKLDSLMRFSKNYILNVGCIVYDEIHMMGNDKRGPTMEFIITLNKRINPSAQIIGLSATIVNADDIAKWLDSKLVANKFRPVKLVKKIYLDNELINGDRVKLKDNTESPLLNIALDLISRKRQALVFSETKKLTVSHAGKLAPFVFKNLQDEEKNRLALLSSQILHALDSPTAQCETLSELVKSGVAFHHAGLVNKQRKLIEENFRSGLIKFIFATPTLAMGVNLPANTVVVSSVYRFGEYRREHLSALEVEQMLGRAGRPKYDKEGTAIIIARSEPEYDFIKEVYIDGETEPIVSGFNNDSAIRVYVLNLVCLELYRSESEIKDFFDGLFISESGVNLESKVEEAIAFLEDNGFIEETGNGLIGTRIGRLINNLYLDPYTGLLFLNFVKKTADGTREPFDIFHTVACSNELGKSRASRSEFDKYEDESYSLTLSADQSLVEYEKFIGAIKTAHIMDDWINEKSENYIEDTYRVLPGELNAILESFRWLIFAMKEIYRLSGIKYNDIIRLQKRMKYGVKEELVPFVSIPDIGRIRARKIYTFGIKTIAELKQTKEETLRRLLGARVGYKVFRYIHKDENNTLLGR